MGSRSPQRGVLGSRVPRSPWPTSRHLVTAQTKGALTVSGLGHCSLQVLARPGQATLVPPLRGPGTHTTLRSHPASVWCCLRHPHS